MVPFGIDYVIPEEDEEMKDVESEETMDEEIQIDDIPQSFIPHKTPDETVPGSGATAEDIASSTKQIPQAEENPQAKENPQPEEKGQNEENAPAPNTETAIVLVNTVTTMIVAPLQEPQHNLQP